MGVLISITDFVGRYAIPQGINTQLDLFITDTEEDYLVDLLGADMYASFKADLSTNKVPQTQKYLNIYNRFKKDYGCKVFRSMGMKEMLTAFIFFDFMRQIKYKATSQGMAVNSPDTSSPVEYGNLYRFLNDATDTFNSIQIYITYISPSDYNESGSPKFNGNPKDDAIPIFM